MELADPVEVFVVDHGRSTSLVIPASQGGLLRYAYGDWQWYALGHQGVLRAVAALLWPTRAGFGRAVLEGPPSAARVRRQVLSVVEIHALRADRERVLAFERRMEGLYRSRRDTEVQSPWVGMSFVEHPRRYTYFWNSNHAVASWLRELGCETRGPSFSASWRVESR